MERHPCETGGAPLTIMKRRVFLDGACTNNHVKDAARRRAGYGIYVEPWSMQPLSAEHFQHWCDANANHDPDGINRRTYLAERAALTSTFPGQWAIYKDGVRIDKGATLEEALARFATVPRIAGATSLLLAPVPLPPTAQTARSVPLEPCALPYAPTNNRAELQAAVTALRAWTDGTLFPPADGVVTHLVVLSDSQFLYQCATDWLERLWIPKGYRTGSGEPVKNDDVLRALVALQQEVRTRGWTVQWTHVSAHRDEPDPFDTSYDRGNVDRYDDWLNWHGNYWADWLATRACTDAGPLGVFPPLPEPSYLAAFQPPPTAGSKRPATDDAHENQQSESTFVPPPELSGAGAKRARAAPKAPRTTVAITSVPPGVPAVVVHLKREKGEILQNCDVYLGRACARGGWQLPTSKWMNPFSVNKYGRDEALRLYEAHIRSKPLLLATLQNDLRGKVLGCWCKPDPCHGDVLVRLLQEQETAHRAYAMVQTNEDGQALAAELGNLVGIVVDRVTSSGVLLVHGDRTVLSERVRTHPAVRVFAWSERFHEHDSANLSEAAGGGAL